MSQSIDLPKVDDFLEELLAIQQTGSKRIAMLGSRHVPITHQQLIELLSYALVLGSNHIITSGATGTNLAVVRGAMRADPNLVTVILPQSLERQPRESRKELEKVIHVVENPKNNHMSFLNKHCKGSGQLFVSFSIGFKKENDPLFSKNVCGSFSLRF